MESQREYIEYVHSLRVKHSFYSSINLKFYAMNNFDKDLYYGANIVMLFLIIAQYMLF